VPLVLHLPDFKLSAHVERADAAENRAAILAAARALLQEFSLSDITMTELAARAGVGQGTLYRRFENRAALAKALLVDELASLHRELVRRNKRESDARRLLIWFVRTLARLAVSKSEIVTALTVKEGAPPNWWVQTDLGEWLLGTLTALHESARGAGDGREYALNVAAVLVSLGPAKSPLEARHAADRLSRLALALLRSERG
jgi:AcrR family transcriptional regulator